MTLEMFINKYNGKFIDFDNSYGPQCVDLMRQYIQEVIKIDPYTIPRANYAKNIYKNFKTNAFWLKIKNTPTGVPQRGDIIFWDWWWPVTGYAGHVAVVSGANVYKFISFDQNYGQPKTCSYKNHDYRGVLGWLHPLK
jgi:hypothetical protein